MNICTVCDKNPTTMNDITTNPNNISKAHLHCHSCLNVFKSVSDLYLHKCNTHTNPVPIKCWTCGKTFSDESELRTHLDNDHMRMSDASNVLPQPSTSQTIHQVASITNPTACELCEQVFPSTNERDIHMMTHSWAVPFSCRLCGFLSQSKETMTLHQESQHMVCPPELHCNLRLHHE